MQFALKEITDFLKSNNIKYSIKSQIALDQNRVFSTASIKSKIESGFYFLLNELVEELQTIQNSLILYDNIYVPNDSNIYIILDNPQYVHYKITAIQKPVYKDGIHETAIIDADAIINANTHIGPFCVLGKCIIENGVVLLGNVTIKDNVIIKAYTVVEEYCVIGATGLAWVWDDYGNRVMQPQTGGVIIEENCFLGTSITIVRGSLSENTVIGKGTIIAHGTKIGHGCAIGEQVHIANNVSIAGNAFIESRVFLGSASVVSSNIKIAEDCIVGAGAVVVKNIDKVESIVAGVPAKLIGYVKPAKKLKGVPQSFKKQVYEK